MSVALRSINSESEGRMLEKKNSKDGLKLRSSFGMASREAFASWRKMRCVCMFRACDLCSHPFSFCSRAIQYLGSSSGGFLCSQISSTLMSCASETADKGVVSSGSGSSQWNQLTIFQHLVWFVYHRTRRYSSVYSIRHEAPFSKLNTYLMKQLVHLASTHRCWLWHSVNQWSSDARSHLERKLCFSGSSASSWLSNLVTSCKGLERNQGSRFQKRHLPNDNISLWL